MKRTPKRLRIIYFFARIRGFILLLMACIGLAIYNAYLVLDQAPLATDELGHTIANASKGGRKSIKTVTSTVASNELEHLSTPPMNDYLNSKPEIAITSSNHHSLIEMLKSSSNESSNPTAFSSSPSTTATNPFGRIRFTCEHPVASMPNHHWSNLFSLYNISLTGRFVSILPPIMLSIPITPERAQSIRNVADSDDEMLRKFVPMKFSNGEYIIADDDL